MDDVLMSAPLFAALDVEAAAALKASMEERRLLKGDVLFAEGDPGDRLYVVTEGKIKLGHASNDGRETLLAVMGEGEMFGGSSRCSTRARARPPRPPSPTPSCWASATPRCAPG